MKHWVIVSGLIVFTTVACGADDGAGADAAPLADAYATTGTTLIWQAPGGFIGQGPALEVLDDGTIHVWDQVMQFDPLQPPATFARTIQVSDSQIADLYARWSHTDTSSLPHPIGPAAEGYPSLYVRDCAVCTATTISYFGATQLEPEMESVWSWFDTALAGEPATNRPRDFCRQ